MNEQVAWAVAIVAVAVGVFAAWHMVRDAPFSNPLFYAVAVLEGVLIAALVGGSIALSRTERDVDGLLLISYLVTMLVIPPVAVLWGVAEKSKWGTGVVVVAMLTVAVLAARVHGIWEASLV